MVAPTEDENASSCDYEHFRDRNRILGESGVSYMKGKAINYDKLKLIYRTASIDPIREKEILREVIRLILRSPKLSSKSSN